MKPGLCIAFFFYTVLLSCKKDYSPNIHSTAHGRFYDTLNNEPLANLAVKVGEYQSHFNGYGTNYFLKNYVGSGVTDANGHYSINFTSTGHGNYYFLEWENKLADVKIINPDRNSTNGSDQTKVINNIGGDNLININVFRQYYIKVRFIVHDNPIPPLYVTVEDTKWSRGSDVVYGKNNDTTVVMTAVKNAPLTFVMNIYDPKANRGYFGTRILFNSPAMTGDTIPGGTYDIYPATFK